jgi:hypothetical protein
MISFPQEVSVEGLHMSPVPSSRVAWALIALLGCLLLFAISGAAQDTSAKSTVHNLREVGEALTACMHPLVVADPYQAIRITARLGFNTRGQPLSSPQFTYVTPNVSDQVKSEYKSAVLDLLTRCTPLSFSPELGATIAGVPLILIFDERELTRVRLGGSSAYVAPAPLPSSQIPSAMSVPPLLPPPTRQEPPIWLPGVAIPVPSLPHGPETSQDRRSRCMFQSGLYAVPVTNFSQYMGLCAQ